MRSILLAKLPTYFSIFGRFVWNQHSHLLHIMWYFNTDIQTFVPSNSNAIKTTFLFLYPFSGWIFQVIGKIRDIDFITNNRCLSRSVTPKATSTQQPTAIFLYCQKIKSFFRNMWFYCVRSCSKGVYICTSYSFLHNNFIHFELNSTNLNIQGNYGFCIFLVIEWNQVN